ncbi:hypothetical protein V2J91_10960 [Pseudomonas alliivorans]|nr:hypothetical protein [Pseudomonas alliivorans]MEE4697136.1 hypothetical protein [Pseudomonas alliivorans]MEE5146601.1 hypothetical protein [Pseudomonas alliivorans]
MRDLRRDGFDLAVRLKVASDERLVARSLLAMQVAQAAQGIPDGNDADVFWFTFRERSARASAGDYLVGWFKRSGSALERLA